MPTVNPSQASLVPPQVHQHTTRITRATLEASLPHLRAALTAATFIAVDAEFSGLPPGGPDAGSSGNIATRYAKLREHVASHALLSIGIAAFRPAQAAGGGAGAGAGPRGAGAEAASSSSSSSFCSLFEIALLPSRPFTLSPSSLTFLVDHGFDFTHHFARPTPSQEPTAQPPAPPPAPPPPPHRALQRELAAHLLSHPTAPLVLHNGLLDLMFLYHAFYAPLPETLDVFVNNIADLRGGSRGGLYDTKYVAEFGQAERVSWLGYLFRRAEREMGTPAVVGGDCGIGSGGNAAQPWRGEERGRELAAGSGQPR
ncbi:ribonuclease H-like domain-containing protein [Zopfochytrium polystomum]|nr:ribonuclease H-like domain-containing protein [Zopfochytrium polystomum]